MRQNACAAAHFARLADVYLSWGNLVLITAVATYCGYVRAREKGTVRGREFLSAVAAGAIVCVLSAACLIAFVHDLCLEFPHLMSTWLSAMMLLHYGIPVVHLCRDYRSADNVGIALAIWCGFPLAFTMVSGVAVVVRFLLSGVVTILFAHPLPAIGVVSAISLVWLVTRYGARQYAPVPQAEEKSGQ